MLLHLLHCLSIPLHSRHGAGEVFSIYSAHRGKLLSPHSHLLQVIQRSRVGSNTSHQLQENMIIQLTSSTPLEVYWKFLKISRQRYLRLDYSLGQLALAWPLASTPSRRVRCTTLASLRRQWLSCEVKLLPVECITELPPHFYLASYQMISGILTKV